MKVISTVAELKSILDECRAAGKTIGLVPTMGALHNGHASLVERSVADNDVTVVSIFVNPTQFNDQNDLIKYPRTLKADCELLAKEGVDIVFAPSVEEMYPEPDTRRFDYAPLDTVMEGKFRPGHFNGVCQVVSKLFAMVEPHKAYFGEKDFQQLAIIRHMVRTMGFDVEIVGCPIVREESGLARSSRNMLLNEAERAVAANIHAVLKESTSFYSMTTVKELHDATIAAINRHEGLEVEYYDIVNGDTLQSIEKWDDADYVVGCITVYCGSVRLIDNIRFK